MHCQYCGNTNGEDDHRCLRCGRRIAGTVVAAPASIGATALAVAVDRSPVEDREMQPARAESPEQPPLFCLPSQKVIPFEQLQRQNAVRFATSAQPVPSWVGAGKANQANSPVQKPAPPRGSAKKPTPPSGQGSLDFLRGESQGEHLLPTGVAAQVFGDGRVAPPMRRMTAGAMDVAMVLIGFGAFAVAARLAGSYLGDGSPGGSGFGAGKAVWVTLSASLILISLFYGLLWTMARRETAGMHWAQLKLVTFDGSPLGGRNRAIRFVSAWLSYCSAGLGLLWALADEESLAFHDHISKTYPAERGGARVLVTQTK